MNRSILAALALAPLLSACPAGRPVCLSDQTRCANDACVRTTVDPFNCGDCGKACPSGFECRDSKCQCPASTTSCDSARCVPTASDPKNCGACDKPCASIEVCNEGKCVAACPPGKKTCSRGCVDDQADRQNCGTCGKPCGQGLACLRGVCRSDLFATCFNSHEIFGLETAGLSQLPSSLFVGNGPQSLAFYSLAGGGEMLAVVDGIDNALYHVESTGTPKLLAGYDPLGMSANQVLVAAGVAWVVNSLDNNVQAIDLSKPVPSGSADGGTASRTVKQIPTAVGNPASAANTNPYLAVAVGSNLYVTLLGNLFGGAAALAAGNKVVEIDPDASGGQGAVSRTYDLAAGAELKPPAGKTTYAQPAGIAYAGGKLYVAVSNGTAPDPQIARGPGFVEVIDLARWQRKALVELGDDCANTGYVLASGDRVYVTCTGFYDPKGQGGVAVLDTTTDRIVAKIPLTCPPGAAGCKQPAPGRAALAGDRLFIGDSGDGRLFVVGTDGRVVHGATNPLDLCLAKPNEFQMIGDLAAP